MQKGLECPECGGTDLAVMQTGKRADFGGSQWRRRRCKDCGERIHTYELPGDVLEFEGVER